MSKRNPALLINDILESCNKILQHTSSINFEEFLKDSKTIDAVIRNFEIIGEAANRLPEEFKEQHPSIDWHKETLTIGMLSVTAPIALAIDIAKGLSSAGIIEKEKKLRAIVSVTRPNASTLVRYFNGTKTDPWLSYSITLNNHL